MKVLILSILLALCIAFVRADGTPYEVTNYGGHDDNDAEKYPSCFDNLEDPPTPYYAAVGKNVYKGSLCLNYAVVMGVTLDENPNVGNMVKVQIVDSCKECKESHIDVSKKAFNYIGKKGAGKFKIIWLAAKKDGTITRPVIYPSSQTKSFAEKKYGLSMDKFVSMFEKQALNMIKKDIKEGHFNKNDVSKTTTTKKTTTTTTTTTTTVNQTPAVTQTANITAVETGPAVVGDIDIVLGESNENTIPEDAPVVGKSKVNDPNKVDETPEKNEVKEQIPDSEDDEGSYSVGILSSVTITGAAGIGLLYLKKRKPNKYNELKQKFPEAFNNIKRSVSRSATSIRRGVTRTATSIRRKNNNKTEVSRHGNHEGYNYREMPEYMFGEDGLPRIQLHDEPVKDFPDANIKIY